VNEFKYRDALRANISEDDLKATIQAAVRRKKKQHAGKLTQALKIASYRKSRANQTHPVHKLFLSLQAWKTCRPWQIGP